LCSALRVAGRVFALHNGVPGTPRWALVLRVLGTLNRPLPRPLPRTLSLLLSRTLPRPLSLLLSRTLPLPRTLSLPRMRMFGLNTARWSP
jgi:hypothetical protein